MSGRHSLSLTVNIHGSVQAEIKCQEDLVQAEIKLNAREAQSITDIEYTWLGAVEIKCQECKVFH